MSSTTTIDPPRRSSGPQHRDTDDLAAGIARQVRSLGRRLGERDADDLAPLKVIQAQLDLAWITAIDGMRRSGHSDADIAAALGVSRQAVRQRWPHAHNRPGPAMPEESVAQLRAAGWSESKIAAALQRRADRRGPG